MLFGEKMKKLILFVVCCTVVCLSSCGAHDHTFAAADCTTPATCTECHETEGNPLGHTSTVGVCRRCGKIQNEEVMRTLNSSFTIVMDEGSAVIEDIADIGSLTNATRYSRLAEADEHTGKIVMELNDIIRTCGTEEELDRMAFQAHLLLNVCPSSLSGESDTAIANQIILYQMFLQQLSSSFHYLSQDLDYLAGNCDRPAKVAHYSEIPDMPTPESIIYGISYDSQKIDSGVVQYMYLIGADEADANLNYNIYLRALEAEGRLTYDISDNGYVLVMQSGTMVSAIMAGNDPQTGYFMIVSFHV